MQVIRDDNAHQGRNFDSEIESFMLTCFDPALSLRIPLAQIQSTTFAFYPDETHSSIRRVFIPPQSPETKRHFCGFCGTHLTSWSEINREEADWIYVSFASLKNESVERLDDAGFLSSRQDLETNILQMDLDSKEQLAHSSQEAETKGAPWFEDMIRGSQLGRIRRRTGEHSSSDGKSRIEWEIIEIEDNDGSSIQGTGKRKYAEEVEMKG